MIPPVGTPADVAVELAALAASKAAPAEILAALALAKAAIAVALALLAVVPIASKILPVTLVTPVIDDTESVDISYPVIVVVFRNR
jgi:hypothetical protein